MEIRIDKKVFSPKFYPYLFDYSHRVECLFGGSASGKSYFIAQKLLLRAISERITILVCRRYGTTLRNSVFSLFKELVEKWQLNNFVTFNESDLRLKLFNKSQILFLGLDSEEKLLSIQDISVIWIEEASEITKDLYEQLNLRMRGRAKNQQIIMSWNPISRTSWLFEFTQNPPESSLLVHSTYKDNHWLKEDYIKTIEELETRNPKKWKIFGLGEWGVDTDGQVFQNYRVEKLDKNEIAKKYEHRAGMDFGYSDPSAIVESFYDKDGKTIFITAEFYKTGQTLDELLEALKKHHLEKMKVWCDSAEPRTIDFFQRHNIRAVPCIKGQNSVNARISFLQNHTIIIDESCHHVIEEFENFSYIKDRDGNFTDKTTHEFSHSIDALGYSYSDIYSKHKIRTLDKAILGL